jgi:deoxyribonuclease V
MKRRFDHDWDMTPVQAQEIQRELAKRVSKKCEIHDVSLVAGVDISSPDADGVATGAVVVLHYPELEVAECKTAKQRLSLPYIPGLLSFRESPLILAACERLSLTPDLILVDGQGVAHPRRLGLASHLGLLWDKPTIGCAKSRLCGRHEPVAPEPGCSAQLIDDSEIIGAALRTKKWSAPLYISIGHKVDLATALQWVLNCCRGYRLPEPTRLAHLAAAGKLKDEEPKAKRYQARLF